MTSLVSASQVVTGQVQSLDSVRAHALPSDAMIFASGTKVQPANQNPGSYNLVESANALTLTTTGSVPVVTQSPFADLYKEGSLYFNGTVGNYVSATATGLMGTQWNTTGMTVEAWVNYPTFTGASISPGGTVSQPYLVGQFQPAGATDSWGFGSNTLGYVCFFYYNGSAVSINATVPLSTNTWNHIAFSCVPGGATANIYVNGTSVATASISGTPTVSGSIPLTLGQYNSNSPCLNAYVADVRITTGAALYTGSSFTVPSAPLSPAATGVAQALIRAGQNSPTIQSGALTFDRGLKQYMNFGPQTFNIVTQGFTAVWRGQFTGTPGNYESFLLFGLPGVTNGAISAQRNGTSGQFYFNIYPSNATSGGGVVSASGTFSQNTPYVITLRYSPVTQVMDVWVNGLFNNSVSLLTSALVGDRTIPTTYVGYPNSQTFLNASSNTLAVYNRALSNVEIYNSYLALNTSTTNAPIEIGDVNGTPALSIAGDGRVNVTKLGQTSNVLPWPPAAMTGYVTSINGGTYVASASTDGYNACWQAFDKSLGSGASGFWQCGPPATLYTSSAPYSYTGTVTTTDVNGTVYPGEWLQIQLPVSVVLSSYSLASQINAPTVAPTAWVVLGSRDGVNWTLISTQYYSGWQAGVYSTFNTNTTQAFSYFRMSCQRTGTGGGTVNLAEWILNGTADTAQTLTVSQPVTLSYGAQTASLTGIANPGVYAPQDFSSSGLNIPAYVVSNTATTANTVAYSSFGPFAGEGSVYFPNGTGPYYGTYINFPSSAPVCFDWTTLDFTIELWFYPTAFSQGGANAGGIFKRITWPVSTYQFEMTLSSSGVVQFYDGASGAAISPSGTATLNAWNHISACVSGSTAYASLNGVVGSASKGSFTYNSALGFVISSGIPLNGSWSGVNGYISNFRVVRGIGLYTAAFTPPTTPLQPIQGTTQAGLPYGTVLLLRNAPAPGRVLTSKFGGANSAGPGGAAAVLGFPPAAMTTYATALSSGYGQGTYVASASTEYVGSANYAWYAFDKSTSTGWSCASGYYAAGTPATYTGTYTTVDVNGTSYSGEWLQIQMPSSTVLANYTIIGNTNTNNNPSRFWIFGSRDGASWNLVDSRTGITWASPWTQTFTVAASSAFTYYRISVNQIQNAGAGSGVNPVIMEWTLNGTIEGPNVTADGRLGLGVSNPVQALEVAGNMVVNGTVSSQSTTFRNVLINGDMRINQRGISTTLASPTAMGTSSTGYAVDRWLCFRGSYAGGGTVAQGTMTSVDLPYQNDGLVNFLRIGRSVGDTSTQILYAINALETKDSYRLAGKSVTMSFYYRTGAALAGTLTAIVASSTGTDQNPSVAWVGPLFQAYTLPASSSWTKVSFSAPIPLSTTQVASQILYTPTTATAVANDYFDVTGVQLEKGTLATPFEVRPYGVELQLCQRYYYRLTSATGSNYMVFGTGSFIGSTTLAQIYIPFPVTMRTMATGGNFSNSVPSTFWFGATGQAATAVNQVGGTEGLNGSQVQFTLATPVTAGTGAIIEANASFSTFLAFNAEL